MDKITGRVTAYMRVEAVGFCGLRFRKSVNLGHEDDVTVEDARALMDRVYEDNPDLRTRTNIYGKFTALL